MLSSTSHQKRVQAGHHDVSKLAVVSAKDYKPGKEGELLEAVHDLLFCSLGVLTHNVNTTATRTAGWFTWNSAGNNSSSEEKKCEMDDVKSGRSGDLTPNEMDGIVDSMSYVLEIMQTYQAKAHIAAQDLLNKQNEGIPKQPPTNLEERVAQADKEGGMWSLQDVAKDMSTADFLFGTLMPNQSGDEYPEGSQPIFPMTSLGPTTDMFLGSISSMLGSVPSSNKNTVENTSSRMESKLKYLEDVQSVSKVCHTQVEELDSILSSQGMSTIFEFEENTSVSSCNSVLTEDVEEQATHPPLDAAAASYIKAARDMLTQYVALAEKLLKDEVKCLVSTYSCAPEKCGDAPPVTEKDGLLFENLRNHFNSDAYDIDFKAYLAAETDNEMQMKLLNTLHSSLFLRNVADKCQQQIRVHVGKEVSVSICELVMSSLLNSKREHRITEWGSMLFSRHVRALHAYAFEFCRAAEGTQDILSKVEVSTLDAKPMDANWERLFSALDVLKLERPGSYDPSKLHPLFTSDDARKILRLRKEFDDDAINMCIPPSS